MSDILFFQGKLGRFVASSPIGGSTVAQAPSASGQLPGSYTPAQSKDTSKSEVAMGSSAVSGVSVGGAGAAPSQAPGKFGAAEAKQ